MQNNYIFKQLLHLTGVGLNKELTIEIFRLGGIFYATNSKIKGWRTVDNDSRSTVMKDEHLEGFMQGLFAYRDMQRADGIEVFNFKGIL